MIEISQSLESDQSGVVRYSGLEALSEGVKYWLNTPFGALPGRPDWGHPFRSLLFGDNGHGFIFLAEMKALEAFERDFPYFQIAAIRIEKGEDEDELYLTLAVKTKDQKIKIKEKVNNVS